jgi:hypothetical protein
MKLLKIISLFFFISIAEAQTFIAISDLHFTPFSLCQKTDCTRMIIKLQQAPINQWDAVFKKYYHSTALPSFNQDTNYPLLLSSMNELHHLTLTQHPKFIVYLGDYLGHGFHREFSLYNDPKSGNYQDFVKKTMEYLVYQIHQAASISPNNQIPVYFVLGNNDSYGGDYVADPHGDFFNDMNHLFGSNQHNELSYYTQDIAPNQELIFLNTNVFSRLARTSAEKPLTQESNNELIWLKTQLTLAKQNHKKIFLFMHIPPSIDPYLTQEASHPLLLVTFNQWDSILLHDFVTLITPYTNPNNPIISGIFASHVHKDTFNLIKNNQEKTIAYISLVPSISLAHINNPAMKVYHYQDTSFEVTDYTTYYLDLYHQATQWKPEYDFDQAYGLSTNNSLLKNYEILMKNLGSDQNKIHLYQHYFADGWDYPIINQKWPYFYCSITNLTESDYDYCIKANKKFLFAIHFS